MLFLQTDYNKGLIFNDAKDAAEFLDIVSRATPVKKEGYHETTTFTPIDEPQISAMEIVKPGQIVRPSAPAEPVAQTESAS